MLGQGGVGAQQGRLLVERGAVVADEGGGNEDGVAAQEDGRGGVEGEVAAGLVRGPEPPVGVGGAVGLALDEVFTVEVELYVVGGPVELHHHVLHLSGLAVADSGRRHGLEPVAVRVGAPVYGPAELVQWEMGIMLVSNRIGLACECDC